MPGDAQGTPAGSSPTTSWRRPSDQAGPSTAREQARRALRERLDRIEALARELADTLSDHDQLTRRFQEIESRERRWADDVERLDADRRQLVEAWEALERERIAMKRETPSAVRPGPFNAAPTTTTTVTTPAPGEGPITRAILQQFQAVRRDVRDAAGRRRSG